MLAADMVEIDVYPRLAEALERGGELRQHRSRLVIDRRVGAEVEDPFAFFRAARRPDHRHFARLGDLDHRRTHRAPGGGHEHRIAGFRARYAQQADPRGAAGRSEEHTSELQSLMRTSYAVLCL